MDHASPPPPERKLDLESLKALAHPLRVQILDTISTYGPFTASGLADRLGESSGATSYHLRQLERHGFVREVAGRGTARERWWERPPGGIHLTPEAAGDSEVGKAASKLVSREWERNRQALLADFQDRGHELLTTEWISASNTSTANLRLTAAQLKEISDAWDAFIDDFIARFRGQGEIPGSRPTQIHFNAFPVIDGDETPA